MILSRVPMRVSVPVVMAAPVLLVAAVLAAISSIQGQAAVDRLTSQQMSQIHDQISQHVHALASMPARANQANIALLESGRLDPKDPRSWAPVLIAQFQAFEVLSAITWGGEDGQCTWIARYVGDDEHLYYAIKDAQTPERIVEYHVDTDGRIASEPAGSFVFDPKTRPWYDAPKRAGRPAWSEPFLWVGGAGEGQATLGIAYGWPYRDSDGELVGIIDADLSLQDLSRYLSQLRIGRTGRAFVMDNDGRLLASSTDAALADSSGRRLHATSSEQDWVAAAAGHLDSNDGSVGKALVEDSEIIEIGGVREWVHASPFAHETGLHWVIVTVVPEIDFTDEIAAGRRRSAWFTVAAIVCTLGLGGILSMLLVRPIITLSAHVRRLGEGKLDGEVHMTHARELVRLSGDINQMTVDLRDRMRMRQSLAVAMQVQQALLPEGPPTIEGLDISGHSTYCDETGGDYYDFLNIIGLDRQSLCVALGDVMGHGVAAAMLMATARGILRSRSCEPGSLADLLTHMNQLLVPDTGGYRFMTMLLVTIDPGERELRWASAGHDPPFCYDPETGQFVDFEGGGLPLGIMDSSEYLEEKYAQLRSGQVIFLATDGVWEMKSPTGEQFGKDRLRHLIASANGESAETIGRRICQELRAFRGDGAQDDDVTFVIVKML